jgi:beta-lactamase superfamily II metal-dependent hydrolase
MTCHVNECLQEAHKTCGTCSDEFCDEHIRRCEECKTWFCDTHFNKHECKEEKVNTKELAIKKSKADSNNNSSHSVALRKSGALDFNTINTSDTVLEIHHIDVEQGDSTFILIKSLKGEIYKSMLIDAGLKSEHVVNYFEQLIKEKNFRPIDILVITHPDKDHVGGAPDILENSKYTDSKAILYDNGMPFGRYDTEYDTYLNCAKDKKLVRMRPPLGLPVTGGIIFEEHGVILRCLACNGIMSNMHRPKESPYYFIERQESIMSDEYSPKGERQMIESNYPKNKNNLSIALHLQFRSFSYYTAGDLSGDWEEQVAYHINRLYGPVSAWKASHHGAQECTTEKVVGYLQGRVCVLSFGAMNSFGHPFQAPIDHLESSNDKKVPCDYYCTGKIIRRDPPSTQYGKLGPNGRDNQGTVIIRAYESQVKKSEIFHVEASKSDLNVPYELEPNRNVVNLKIAPSPHKGKSSNPKSPDEKSASAERKRQREKANLSKATNALKEKILSIIRKKEDDWPGLYATFKEKFDEKVAHIAKSKGNQLDYSQDPVGVLKRAANEVIGKR